MFSRIFKINLLYYKCQYIFEKYTYVPKYFSILLIMLSLHLDLKNLLLLQRSLGARAFRIGNNSVIPIEIL